MDAFAVADELLGDIQLTSGQLAGLRAINHRYFTEVYALLHPPGEQDAHAAAGGEPALTARQTAELRVRLERDVRDLLTPAQRASIGAGVSDRPSRPAGIENILRPPDPVP